MGKKYTLVLFDGYRKNPDFELLAASDYDGKFLLVQGLPCCNEFLLNGIYELNPSEWNFVLVNRSAKVPLYKLLKLLPYELVASFTVITPHSSIRDSVKSLGVNKMYRNLIDCLDEIKFEERLHDEVISKKGGFMIQNHKEVLLLNPSLVNYIIADGSWSVFYIKNNNSTRVSKNLKNLAYVYDNEAGFLRLSRSMVVNLNEVCRIEKREENDGILWFRDNTCVELSGALRVKLVRILRSLYSVEAESNEEEEQEELVH